MSVEKIKEHIKRHKMFYISAGCVALGIGIAVLAGRIVKNYQIGVELLDAASVELLDAGKNLDQRELLVLPRRELLVPDVKGSIVNYGPNNGIVGNVSYISANRQGPPSWVIQCLETGQLYTSQNSAAEALGLNSPDISRHLNGLKEHVNNLHFERICMAA